MCVWSAGDVVVTDEAVKIPPRGAAGAGLEEDDAK